MTSLLSSANNSDHDATSAVLCSFAQIMRPTIGGSTPTNVGVSYGGGDVNMDGTFKYTGTENDRDIILQTIGGVVPTAVRVEQLS